MDTFTLFGQFLPNVCACVSVCTQRARVHQSEYSPMTVGHRKHSATVDLSTRGHSLLQAPLRPHSPPTPTPTAVLLPPLSVSTVSAFVFPTNKRQYHYHTVYLSLSLLPCLPFIQARMYLPGGTSYVNSHICYSLAASWFGFQLVCE